MSFLYALEGIRTPVLDKLMGAVTYLGDEIMFIVAAIIIFWCISKKWGYYVLCVGFFGTLINQFVKILCRVPRPWVRDPNFTIVENARAAATGYSFPSGHTANVSATLGCSARAVKSRAARVVFLIIIAVVSFSRMYLGVHYPADVGFSLVVSAVLVFAAYPLFANSDERPARVYLAVAVLTVLGLCFALFTQLHRFPADTDPDNLYEATKNAWLLTGCGLAMLLGLCIERRYVNFDVHAPLLGQVLKVVLGLAILLGLRIGLKPLLALALGDAPLANGIRYFILVLFASCIWPMTFRWFAAVGRKKK